MRLWQRLFPRPAPGETPSEPERGDGPVIALPSEPFVFECRTCGKIFEARRKRPLCPECDEAEVDLLA
jgi:Zn finger protein HypA/HybF involved in hydrogenase expression